VPVNKQQVVSEYMTRMMRSIWSMRENRIVCSDYWGGSMKRSVFLLVVSMVVASPAFALFSNAGFELGSLSGWDCIGDVSVVGMDNGIAPAEGQFMAKIEGNSSLIQYAATLNDIWAFRSYQYCSTYAGSDPGAFSNVFTSTLYGYCNGAWVPGLHEGAYFMNADSWGNWRTYTGGYFGMTPPDLLIESMNPWFFQRFRLDITAGANTTLYLDGFDSAANPYNSSPYSPVPEPSTLLLLSSGLIGLAGGVIRFRNRTPMP
jgi:hypothetical protein